MIESLGLRRCIAQFEALIGSADWLRLLRQGDSNLAARYSSSNRFTYERTMSLLYYVRTTTLSFVTILQVFVKLSLFARNVDLFARAATS